jgi:hypothetical protein
VSAVLFVEFVLILHGLSGEVEESVKWLIGRVPPPHPAIAKRRRSQLIFESLPSNSAELIFMKNSFVFLQVK